MNKRYKKITSYSNFDTATAEEKEKIVKNVIEAWMVLYKSVVERKTKEYLNNI